MPAFTDAVRERPAAGLTDLPTRLDDTNLPTTVPTRASGTPTFNA